MTTISELLKQEPREIITGINLICNWTYSHIPEIPIEEFLNVMYNKDFAPEIKTFIFYDVFWDWRRSQKLFAVKYQERWIMLCSNAGRECSDYSSRQILDAEGYLDMLTYLRTELASHSKTDPVEVTSLDSEVQFIFYGHDVRDIYINSY
jgi:hypothetical protein